MGYGATEQDRPEPNNFYRKYQMAKADINQTVELMTDSVIKLNSRNTDLEQLFEKAEDLELNADEFATRGFSSWSSRFL